MGDNLADLSEQGLPLVDYGFPALAPDEIPACAGNETQPPCNRSGKFFLHTEVVEGSRAMLTWFP